MKRLNLIVFTIFFILFTSISLAQEEKIALIMKASTNPFFIKMREGAIRASKDIGISLNVFSIKYETDILHQIDIVDNIIKSGEYRGIIIAPADSVRLIPILKKAKESGIFVINIDNKLDDPTLRKYGLNIPFIGPDNFKAAKRVGEYVKFKLKGKGNILIVEGIPSALNAKLRKEGFIEGVSGENINIVSFIRGDWDQDVAFNNTISFFEHYNEKIDAILCANDKMALGISQALYFLEKEGIIVTGYDNIKGVRILLYSHKIHATVEQYPDIMGRLGVIHMKDLMEGKKLPKTIEVPTDLITYESFGKHIAILGPELPIPFKKSIAKRAALFGEDVSFYTYRSSKLLLRDKKSEIDLIIALVENKNKTTIIEDTTKDLNIPVIFLKFDKHVKPNLSGKGIIDITTSYFKGSLLKDLTDYKKDLLKIKR